MYAVQDTPFFKYSFLSTYTRCGVAPHSNLTLISQDWME